MFRLGLLLQFVSSSGVLEDEDVPLVQFKESLEGVVIMDSKNVARSSGNLDSIEKMVSTLEETPKGKWSDAEKTLIKQLKDSLKDQMEPYLSTEHDAALVFWQSEVDKYNLCATHKESRLHGDVKKIADSVELARKLHKLCRVSQKNWNGYIALKSGDGSVPSSLNVADNDRKLCKGDDAIIPIVKRHASNYNDFGAGGNIGGGGTCDDDQLTFEGEVCKWYTAKFGACSAFDDCVSTVDLPSTRSTLLDQAENRKKLFTTIQFLECRLDHMLKTFDEESPSKFATKDECSKEKQSTSHLDLILHIPDEAKNKPCSGDTNLKTLPNRDASLCAPWKKEEYDWDDGVVPGKCLQTCSYQAPVHWRKSSSWCTQDDDKCWFYDLHADACGKYDARDKTFRAKDVCCACRAKGGRYFATENGLFNVNLQFPPAMRVPEDGPYDLALNVDTDDGHHVSYANWLFWEEKNHAGGASLDPAQALSRDFKNLAAFSKAGLKHILIVVHIEGAVVGWRQWETFTTSSLASYFATGNTCHKELNEDLGQHVGVSSESQVEIGTLDAHEPMVRNEEGECGNHGAQNLYINAGMGKVDFNRMSTGTGKKECDNRGWGLGTHYDSKLCSYATLRPMSDAQVHVDKAHWGSQGGIGAIIGTDNICNGNCPWTTFNNLGYDYAIFVAE